MPRKCLRWMWSHRKLTFILFLAFLFVALNVLAYNHAHAMTHFSSAGEKTGKPETLSLMQKAGVCLLGINVPKPVSSKTPDQFGLPFTTHTFHGTGGIELEAWHIPAPGAKGVVVMVHGYAACKSQLLPEAKALHELGYSTFLLDCRGSGGSSGNKTTIGVYEADDVAAAIEQVRSLTPDEPLILYGRSMGSAAILRAVAVNGVAPSAVVIECPFDKLLSTIENRFSAMGLPSFPLAPLLVFWGGAQHGFNGFTHNPVEYARHVRCPVLLLHGARDARVTQEQAQSLFDNLAGEKQFKVFENVGHEPYQAANPDAWNRVVSAFLSSHSR